MLPRPAFPSRRTCLTDGPHECTRRRGAAVAMPPLRGSRERCRIMLRRPPRGNARLSASVDIPSAGENCAVCTTRRPRTCTRRCRRNLNREWQLVSHSDSLISRPAAPFARSARAGVHATGARSRKVVHAEHHAVCSDRSATWSCESFFSATAFSLTRPPAARFAPSRRAPRNT